MNSPESRASLLFCLRAHYEQYGSRFVGYLETLQLFLHLAAPGRYLLRHSGWDLDSHVSYSPSLRLATGTGTLLQGYYIPHLRGPGLLATRHPSSQRPRTTRQHHFRVGHGLHQFSRVSKRSSAAVQLALYRTLELSADDADACVSRLAGAPHLAAARITHLVLPHFVNIPPAAHVVPPNAASHLAVLDSSPGLAAALGSRHPLCCLTLRIATTLYDGLHPAALFGALGGTRKELGLILAPNVDIRTRGRIRARGSRYLSCLRGTSDEVSLLPDVQALRTLRLWATLATEAQGRRRPVASRGMETASAGIGIALHRVSFGGTLGTRAGS
ncbi:hypothetical protein EDB89DRAFT_2079140 [Lactarius sanguifluus]|nr:hypothetical protein EDB89DRAFT_2079140 [Lactarius sanguifluus]